MKWFRFYSGFPQNPKIKSLSVHRRYAFVVLLCLACGNQPKGWISGIDDEDLAFELEMSIEDWDSCKAQFIQSELIALNGTSIQILGWEKWQHPDFERLPKAEWAPLRLQIFERDGFTCQYCGACGVKLQCDHVLPISRGGSNAPENLATACRTCNQSKHNKTPGEWRREVR